MPIYTMTHTETKKVALVMAQNEAAAYRHVARADYTAARPTMAEYGNLLLSGIPLETAGAELPPPVDTKTLPLPFEGSE